MALPFANFCMIKWEYNTNSKISFKMKNIIAKWLPILTTVLLIILGGCGKSECYENGYESGVSHGEAAVRRVMRITNANDQRFMDSGDFDAESAYVTEMQSMVQARLDGKDEEDFRDGFIDGYEDGVDNQLKSAGKTSSASHKSSTSQTKSYTSSSNSGINFWRWCVIVVVSFILFSMLGATELDKKITVGLWKSFLLIIITFIGCVALGVTYNCNYNNWSLYILFILALILNGNAIGNARAKAKTEGKSFFGGLIIVLGYILAILYVWNIIRALYSLIFK